jgi:hypothetical protein
MPSRGCDCGSEMACYWRHMADTVEAGEGEIEGKTCKF